MDVTRQYLEITTKKIACDMYSINYYDFYAKIYVYRQALPKHFMTILVQQFGCLSVCNVKKMAEIMYSNILSYIPLIYRNICISYIIEYIVCMVPNYMQVFEIFPGRKEELWGGLGVRYDLSFEKISTDLQVIHKRDVILFNQIAYRISTYQLNMKTGLHFQRALEYSLKLKKFDENQRIYLNDGNFETSFLCSFQKIYETTFYARIPLDDFVSRGNILDAFTSQKPYAHSQLGGKCMNSRCFDIIGKHCILHIFVPVGKPLNTGHIQGTLEILSYKSDFLFCDRRLDHDLIPSERELLKKFDNPTLIYPVLMQNQICDLKPDVAQERIFYVLQDIIAKPYVFSEKSMCKTNDVQCCKKKLLNLKRFMNYENNMQTIITFVNDFLLWILSRKI